MELKPGFKIKLLTAIRAGNIIIPKNDVVTVIDNGIKGIVIQDILDNKVILPRDASFKIVGTSKVKMQLTSAVIPYGSVYELEKRNLAKIKPSIARTRAVQLAQVIASNAAASVEPTEIARLSVASSILAMSLSEGMDQNQFSKLYQLARKVIQVS